MNSLTTYVLGVSKMNDNSQILDWLYGLNVHGIKLGLENTYELLSRLENPQNSFHSIHIAGTDGKGSVSSMLFSILNESGIRSALYTSPHLVNFNERMRTTDGMISDNDLLSLAERVRPIVEEMAEKGMYCTFFEVTTAMAFLYFSESKIEYAVIEVGMGGRFDSTNVLVPDVCVINNISLEHTEYLGSTIEKIAFEKAGILKQNVPAVSINSDIVVNVLQEVADEIGADFVSLNTDKIKILKNGPDGVLFEYEGKEYLTGIPGRRQARNAVLAIEAIKAAGLSERTTDYLDIGLKNTYWPCRLEKIPDVPIILDVTHTAAGSKVLMEDVSEIYGKVTLVFGVLNDKDLIHISENLSKIADNIVITSPDSDRAEITETILSAFEKLGFKPTICNDVGQAIDYALKIRNGNILVTGSLYMAGDAMKWLKRTFV